ncbi:MAG: hypothetical protein U9Q22_00540 [Candidatus Altiarchaeota archaeon]|nr:hypothetical protein [Candidatus Altiarchaeota archaeon]
MMTVNSGKGIGESFCFTMNLQVKPFLFREDDTEGAGVCKKISGSIFS